MNRADRHENRGRAAAFFAGILTMLIVGIVVVTIGIVSGWMSFSAGRDRTHISVDRHELQRDTDAAMEAGRETMRQAGEALERTGEAVSDSTDNS